MSKKQEIGEIASIFMEVRDNMRLYHWNTKSYARHKASDAFIGVFTTQMDVFMETIIGLRGDKGVKMPKSIKIGNLNDKEAVEYVLKFKKWLADVLPTYLKKSETELFNQVDEIKAETDKLLYLFTLN